MPCVEPFNGTNEMPVSEKFLVPQMCLLFKSFTVMMHTSALLIGTCNRSWCISVCVNCLKRCAFLLGILLTEYPKATATSWLSFRSVFHEVEQHLMTKS